MPSLAMQQVLRQMHTMVEQQQQFFDNINYSNCYYSVGMQKYGPDDRRALCARQ